MAEIEEVTYFQNAGFFVKYSIEKDEEKGWKHFSTVKLNVFLLREFCNDKGLMLHESQKAVNLFLNNHNDSFPIDKIEVSIRTGFNIGIASWYEIYRFDFSSDGKVIEKAEEEKGETGLHRGFV